MMEAQLETVQEEIEKKDELQRLCDQYRSKIKEYKKKEFENVELQCENEKYRRRINEYDMKNKKFKTIICEKNKEMMKLLKTQEKNKSQIKKLTTQYEECEHSLRINRDITKDFAKHFEEADYIERLNVIKELNRKSTRYKAENPDL